MMLWLPQLSAAAADSPQPAPLDPADRAVPSSIRAVRASDPRSAVWLAPLTAGWSSEHMSGPSSHHFLSASTQISWLFPVWGPGLMRQAVVTVLRSCKLIDFMEAMMHCD